MPDAFSTVSSIDYPISDADAHVYEPPEVWQERVAARLHSRAPKVLRTDEGDVWSFNDGERLRPVGLMAAAGASCLDFRPSGLTYDSIRRGHYDLDARLADTDAVGIELRHRLNLDHLVWSTDYPHTGTDWPNSGVTIERVFRGVPRDEVKRMLHTNCKTLYGLDEIPAAW
jgi:hypothetical protein